MNKNLPQAAKLIRETVGCSETYAQTVAHELNKAGLLVDPERSYGVILHRRATGGWSPDPRTELETQALAWDASCRRAAELATRIRTECGEGRGLLRVQEQGDRLLVTVQVTAQEQWAAWRTYLGVTTDEPQTLEYAHVVSGHRDGVAVSLVAYDVQQVEARTAAAARMPYRHGGVVYDLALPQRDSQGDIWDYAGCRKDGVPLLHHRDVDAGLRCSLPNVVDLVGPLLPVRDDEPVPGVRETVAAAAAEGGERA
ncbi:BN159_2729 family protein [Streptomyces sp. NPDC006274]|uniref:BN159_2729 family protein n=1 Tax=unclassified Streptomyces TaxID=2593676 RepID=UPI0033A3794F